MAHVLPDVLVRDLDVVFCGTAAGTASARKGAYYAGPGNRFWSTLHEVGLTPDRALDPSEFKAAIRFGIGLTDIAKHTSGQDSDLKPTDFDAHALRRKIEQIAPWVLAFNGKKSASVFLDMRSLKYGRQQASIGRTAVFVLPSTSAAARKYWDIRYWRELSEYISEARTRTTREHLTMT